MVDLDKLEELAKEATAHLAGHDLTASTYGRMIFGQSKKGGHAHVFDIRGWGYLTGKGGGALGLSEEQAIEAQKAIEAYVVAAWNAVPELIALARRDGVEEPVAWRWQEYDHPEDPFIYGETGPREHEEHANLTPLFAHPAPTARRDGVEERVNSGHGSVYDRLLTFIHDRDDALRGDEGTSPDEIDETVLAIMRITGSHPAPTASGDGGGLTADDHAVIRRCTERQPKLFMRGQHEGYYVHSDVSDLIDIIGRLSALRQPDTAADPQAANLSASNAELIDQALSHPPLSTPSTAEDASMAGGSDAPEVRIVCEVREHGIIGTTTLQTVRVEREDDGSLSAFTDFWPTPTAEDACMAGGEPIGWARRWFFYGVKPQKERNANGRMAWPKRFTYHEVTKAKIFQDDVALYASTTPADPRPDPLEALREAREDLEAIISHTESGGRSIRHCHAKARQALAKINAVMGEAG
jgi:hypothetical protein